MQEPTIGYIIDFTVVNRPLNKRPIVTLSLETIGRNHTAITLTELTLSKEEIKYLVEAAFKHHPITLTCELKFNVIREAL